MITPEELCTRLACSPEQLAEYDAQGLPSTGNGKRRRYEPSIVREWLILQGYAESQAPSEPITLRTIPDVAKFFNVSSKTVDKWLKQGMPGRPGPRGKQDGYFLVHKMRAWIQAREKRLGFTNDATSEREKLTRVNRKLREIVYAEKLGAVLPVETVGVAFLRAINEAKTQLEQMPAAILKILPAGLDQPTRRRVRERIERLIEGACSTLAKGALNQAEDEDQPYIEPSTEAPARKPRGSSDKKKRKDS